MAILQSPLQTSKGKKLPNVHGLTFVTTLMTANLCLPLQNLKDMFVLLRDVKQANVDMLKQGIMRSTTAIDG